MANYYVDAILGNDDWTGGIADPWKTVAKVNAASFAAGDSILFARGCIWREQLAVPSSGLSGLPIMFTSYGFGVCPTLTGAIIPTSGSWTQLAEPNEHCWQAADEILPYRVTFNGTVGTKYTDIADIEANEFGWGWDANVLYVHSTTNPAIEYTNPGVEVDYQTVVLWINGKSYITTDGLIVERANASGYGISINGAGPTGITIKNCIVRYVGWDGIILSGNTTGDNIFELNTVQHNGRHGIHVYQSTASAGHENLIRVNEITDWGQNGIQLFSTYSTAEHNTVHDGGAATLGGAGIATYDNPEGDGSWGDNNIIRRNLVYNCTGIAPDGGGILIDHYSDNNQVYYNVVYGCDSYGIDVFKSTGTNVYNNTCYGNNTKAGATIFGEIVLWDDRTANTNIKNNIGYAIITGTVAIQVDPLVTNNAGISITNNCWYKASGNWWHDGVGGSDLPTWNAKSFVGTDLNADPLFINTAGKNFRLRFNSPCKNAGVSVGLTKDFGGRAIIGNPDIGAYEFAYPSYFPVMFRRRRG